MKRLAILLLLTASFAIAQAQVPTDTAGLRSMINSVLVSNGQKSITAKQLNDILTGIVNLMKPYAVDSAYKSGDTMYLIRKGGYTSIKVYVPGGGVSAESDPTVPTALKSLSPTDVARWDGKQDKLNSSSTVSVAANIVTAQNLSPLWNANKIMGRLITDDTPTTGQVLKWNGSSWAPAADDNSGVGGGGSPTIVSDSVAIVAESITQLRAETITPKKRYAQVLSATDGQLILFKYNDTAGSLPNNITTFKPLWNTGLGLWERVIVDNRVHIKSLGVRGDNSTTEVAAIKNAFILASEKGWELDITGTTLNLNNDSLVLTKPLKLFSTNRSTSILRNGKYLIPRAGLIANYITIRDFTSSAIAIQSGPLQQHFPINKRWLLSIEACHFINNYRVAWEMTPGSSTDTTTNAAILIGNFSRNIVDSSKFAAIQLDMPYDGFTVDNNEFKYTGDGAVFNEVLHIGLDGQKNVYKQRGLRAIGNYYKDIVHTQSVSGTFYGVLLSGLGMVYSGNIHDGLGGPVYLRGDDTKADANQFYQYQQYVKYAMIIKDGNPWGSFTGSGNIIRGYYGSGFYFDTQLRTINLPNNDIVLDPKDANVGDACIRIVAGDSTYKQISITGGSLTNNQTASSTAAIWISSTGNIDEVIVDAVKIESKAGGVSAKLINSTGKVVLRNCPSIKFVGAFSLGASVVEVKNNQWNYSTGLVNLYPKKTGYLQDNKVNPDGSATLLTRMFNIESDPNTNSAEYFLKDNISDMTKLTNFLRVEDTIGTIHIDGDRVINGVAGTSSAYISSVAAGVRPTLRIYADNFKNPFNSVFLSSSTSNQKVSIFVKNGKLGRQAPFTFTGASQSYDSLLIENVDMPWEPVVTQGFTYKKFKRYADEDSLNQEVYSGHFKEIDGVLYLQDSVIGGGSGSTDTSSLSNRINNKLDIQALYGTIYKKSTWSNLSDFYSNGATASVSSGKISISGGSGFTQSLDLNGHTMLEKWKIKAQVKIITRSSGFGLGIRGDNYSPVHAIGHFSTNTDANGGKVFLYAGVANSNVATSTSALTIATNDVIEVTVERDVNKFTITARNVTTNSTSVSATYTYTMVSPHLNNTGRFAFMQFGGTNELQSLEITSNELKNANLMTIGDSKTQGYYAESFFDRYSTILSQTFGPVVINAGGYDRTSDVRKRYAEIKALAPKQVLLAIGSNDIRSGVSQATYEAYYEEIVDTLESYGIKVFHLLPFKETTLDQTALKTFIESNYPANRIIDTYTPTLAPGLLDADGVHPNAAGNRVIANAIINSYLLSYADPRQFESVDFNNIVVNKPTTIAGYGITDGITGSGTNFTLPRFNNTRSLTNSSLSENGTTVFSALPKFELTVAGSPDLIWNKSDGVTDEKTWSNYTSGTNLYFRTVNDARNAATTWLQVNRTGTTPNWAYYNTNVMINTPTFISGYSLNSLGKSLFQNTVGNIALEIRPGTDNRIEFLYNNSSNGIQAVNDARTTGQDLSITAKDIFFKSYSSSAYTTNFSMTAAGLFKYSSSKKASYDDRTVPDWGAVKQVVHDSIAANVGLLSGRQLVKVNDSDYTIASGTGDITVILWTMTADRTFTLPSAATNTGRRITIKNSGASAFSILLSTPVYQNASTSFSSIINDRFIVMESDGTNWIAVMYN